MARGGKREGAGRPRSPNAKRAALMVRVDDQVRQRLQASADRGKRSLSREIHARLVASFDEDKATRFKELIAFFDGPETFALMQMMVMTFKGHVSMDGRKWFDDPYRFDVAVRLLSEFLSRLRPSGDIRPDLKSLFGASVERLSESQKLSARHVEAMLVASIVSSVIDGVARAPKENRMPERNAEGGWRVWGENMTREPAIKRNLGKALLARLTMSEEGASK